ncbi:hypothetical protein BDZ97DRAFT_1835256 [Flammula alnicola]|nr:hypothetical protein BDZ97DRAFT_1835256 [Flammula alnicola]
MQSTRNNSRVFQERTNSPKLFPSHSTSRCPQPTPYIDQYFSDNSAQSVTLTPVKSHLRATDDGRTQPLMTNELSGETAALHNVRVTFQQDQVEKAGVVRPIYGEYTNDNALFTEYMTRPPTLRTKDYEAARLTRYLRAEEALAESLQRCIEHERSPHDLQIDALRRATSVLNAHAVDAGERVAKLRGLLANRQTEPELYTSMQRQRWMEERRQLATEHLSKVLQQNLSTLSSLPPPPAHLNGGYSDSIAKSKLDHNLDQFLESSWTRVPGRHRTRRRVPTVSRSRQEKKVDKTDFPRIHNHKHLLPLRLSAPNLRPSFVQSAAKKPAINFPILPASPAGVSTTSSPTMSTSSSVTLAEPLFQLEPISEAPEITIPSQPPTPTDVNGTATIWHSSLRSTEEILSDLVIAMPDYVGDLLAGFDSNTTAPSTSLAIRTRESPSPESSSPGIAFAPDTPQSQRTSAIPQTLHKSPSRRRLSHLLSLPEAFTSRLGSQATDGSPRVVMVKVMSRLRRRMSALRRIEL